MAAADSAALQRLNLKEARQETPVEQPNKAQEIALPTRTALNKTSEVVEEVFPPSIPTTHLHGPADLVSAP